jgi:predicted nucleic acid-binding protein
LVPLLVSEPATPVCQELWNVAEEVFSVRLLQVEAAAALAQASRMKRISETAHDAARDLLSALMKQIRIVEVDATLIEAAGVNACRHGLRGYDAVHCAAAAILPTTDLVAASGDIALLAAWKEKGLMTANVMDGR